MASLIPTFEDIRKKNRENALNAQSKTNYWSNIDNRPNSQTQSNTLKTLASLNNDRANSAVNVVRNTFTNDNSQKTPSYDLNRSAVGGLRDNDSNFSYFTNKSFKSVLGDNADTSKMTYQNLVDTYNNASGDQQADIKKAISDEIINQREYAKKGQQGSLKIIDYLSDLNSVLNQHGQEKGKSFGRQIGDWLSTGGIVGNIGGNTLTEGLGHLASAVTGNSDFTDRTKAHLEKQQNARQDLGAIGALDTGLSTVGNFAMNMGTGGAVGLANAGVGGANALANTINDRVLDYDNNGNAIIRHKTNLEKAGELGEAGLNAAFAIAGKKGIGPSLEPTKITANGLAKLSAKDIAKYAAKELPWAGATTYLQQGLSNISQGKDWGNMDAGEFTKDFLLNLGQDVGMDAANYGAGKIASNNAQKSNQNPINYDNAGNAIKTNLDGSTSRLSDSELAEVAKSQPNNTENILGRIATMDNEPTTRKGRLQSNAEALKRTLTGQNTLTPAYAGVGAGNGVKTVNTATKTNPNASYTVVKGGAPDGSNLVKTDYNLPKDASVGEIGRVIRDTIQKRFQGNSYRVGDSGIEALVNKKTKDELFNKQANMSDADFVKKGSMIGNYDELLENMTNIRTVENHKKEAKPKVDHYVSGRVAVDLGDGKIYYPRVDVEISKQGKAIGYDIADIKEAPRLNLQEIPSRAANSQLDDTEPHSRTSIIPEKSKSVNPEQQERFDNLRNVLAQRREVENAPVEIVDNSKDVIKKYYKKYGDEFYEKMPDNLQQRYDEMLARQPRDKNDVYTDPITGDKMIDEAVSSKNNNEKTRSYEAETEKLPDDFDIKHYVSDQVKAQKARSKVSLKERIADTTAELKHYLVDDAVAYERYIKDKNERLNIREGVDRVRASDMIAKQWMEDHGMKEIGKMSNKDMNEFQQYLIAKRANVLADRNIKTGRSRTADDALIRSVGNKYAKQEQIIRDYTKAMLEYSADNGLISQKLKDDLLKDNDNYIPMNRVFDVLEKKTGFKSKQLGNLSKQTVVQRLEGSERTVENPIESLMTNTMRMVNEVERNKTAKLIAESKAFHEKVLKDGEEPMKGYDKLSYMIEGKKVSYEVPELVAREMKNLNNVMPKATENILKAVGAPTRWLRSGATQNNPLFALSNLARDQGQTLITGSLTANLRGTPKAIIATFSPGKEGKALRAELSRAGIIGSEYRQTYGYKSGELVKELQNNSKLGKQAIEIGKHPINALADLIGRTEYFTRAQQYYGTKGDATAKAQAARNNTLNFSRAGATTRVLNRIIPFLNAGVQGGRITVNSVKERPIHTALSMASLAGVAYAARAAFAAQDQELWDRIDDSDKEQNIIIPTADAHYDPETNRVEGIIKIPVAQMTYPIMDAINNAKGDVSDFARIAGDIFTAMTGLETPNSDNGVLPVVNQLTPTAVKPFLETAMNKSTYTGNEIVSEYDSNKAPEDKGAKYTSGTARTIAKVTGIDAPVIDNFIQNWGGGLAKDLSKSLTDNTDNKSDGGGIGKMFESGFNRRFLSGTITSQYSIAEGLAKNYKDTVKANDSFKNLSAADQQKVLNAIDSDTQSIASMATKVERGRTDDIGDKKLSARQTEITNNGFSADSYIKSVIDKKQAYKGTENGGDITTLTGNVSDYGKSGGRKNTIEISDKLSADHRGVLEKYNSMSSEDWDKYLYGNSPESATAEYSLAKAKYENDLAKGELTDVQKIKRQKELAKLEVSRKWTKDVRDVYSLAGTKADIQELLDGLDGETREKMVGMLNGLNNAMYEAGVISKSTYNSRGRNINNLTSGKSSGGKSSGISSAEASALKSATKALSNNAIGYEVKTLGKPTTSRQIAKTAMKQIAMKSYTPKKATISVKKGK